MTESNAFASTSPLVDCHWLADRLGQSNLVLLDASMKTVIGREPVLYEQPCYIPGAQVLDLEQALCDTDSTQVHAFPSAEIYQRVARSLGINQDSLVVIYDNQGIYSAPRAWWIFNTMGFEQVFVLNGGLPQWLDQGRQVVNEPAAPGQPGNVVADLQADQLCGCERVLAVMQDNSSAIVDVRSSARFLGQAAEPRAGVRSGHIPGSYNLPFADVLTDQGYLSESQLRERFTQLLPTSANQLVFSCGSGITACIVLLAAVLAGYQTVCLYDGSWAEWGASADLPIVVGEHGN